MNILKDLLKTYLLPKARAGYKMGNYEVMDALLNDALIDAFNNYHMGVTAGNLAEKYEISREGQEQLALLSHQRACQATTEGRFQQEIIPIEIKSKKDTVLLDTDEYPNFAVNLESLAKLRPAFKKEGTVTAGNASSLNDGASALILMTAEKTKELGVKPLAQIVASASATVDPKLIGIGVVPAVERALKFAYLELE